MVHSVNEGEKRESEAGAGLASEERGVGVVWAGQDDGGGGAARGKDCERVGAAR